MAKTWSLPQEQRGRWTGPLIPILHSHWCFTVKTYNVLGDQKGGGSQRARGIIRRESEPDGNKKNDYDS